MTSEGKTNGTKDAEKSNKSGVLSNPMVIAALITALCALMSATVTAILNPDLWIYFWHGEPATTPAFALLPSETPNLGTETLPRPIYTDAGTSALTPSAGELHMISPTSTEPPTLTPTPAEVMTVVLEPPSYSVKLGQHVNINARKSYVTFRDGSIYNCSNPRLCRFSWTIFHRESGDSVFITDTDNGILSYTFPRRGDYIITARVCRGVCGIGFASVTVR